MGPTWHGDSAQGQLTHIFAKCLPYPPSPHQDSHLTQPIGWSSLSNAVRLGPTQGICAYTDEPDPVPSSQRPAG